MNDTELLDELERLTRVDEDFGLYSCTDGTFHLVIRGQLFAGSSLRETIQLAAKATPDQGRV